MNLNDFEKRQKEIIRRCNIAIIALFIAWIGSLASLIAALIKMLTE